MDKRPAPGGQAGPPAKRPAVDDDDMIDDIDDFGEEEELAMMPPEEGDVDLGEAGRNWTRPPVQPFNPETDAISTRRDMLELCLDAVWGACASIARRCGALGS